jgi:acetyltransferase-like isoleucine patch superfamily enzyme/ketosteroid isomerase-like protein
MNVAGGLRRLLVVLRTRGRASIDRSARIDAHVRIVVERGATLVIGPGCRIEPHVRVFVRSGRLELARGVVLRERSSVVVLDRVAIGERVDVGERAAIIDLRPSIADVELPLREQRVVSLGVQIGDDAVIGPAAVVETGARVAAGERVGAGVAISELSGPPSTSARSATIEHVTDAADQGVRREQVARTIFDAFAQRDAQAGLPLLAPSIVLEAVSGQIVNDGRPYVGHDGIERYFADVEAHWRKLELEPTQIRAAGDAVVALGRVSGIASGGPLRDAPTTWIFKFEGDLVARIQIFSDPELARRAIEGDDAPDAGADRAEANADAPDADGADQPAAIEPRSRQGP